MTDTELLQQALDALINAKGYIFYNVLDDKGNRYDTAIEALRARLAQPEPEPVAWIKKDRSSIEVSIMSAEYMTREGFEPLYTTPPQREWQGLTEYEVGFLTVFDGLYDVEAPLLANFIRHIEAKLKEKNT